MADSASLTLMSRSLMKEDTTPWGNASHEMPKPPDAANLK